MSKSKQLGMVSAHQKLTIQISKTADGQQNYMQILSGDQFSLNIVLIADEIVVDDRRKVTSAD